MRRMAGSNNGSYFSRNRLLAQICQQMGNLSTNGKRIDAVPHKLLTTLTLTLPLPTGERAGVRGEHGKQVLLHCVYLLRRRRCADNGAARSGDGALTLTLASRDVALRLGRIEGWQHRCLSFFGDGAGLRDP